MSMTKNESFSISGQSFKIIDQFEAACPRCGDRHQIYELSRLVVVESEIFIRNVDCRCMYCTATGDLFVTPDQHEANKRRIYDALPSDTVAATSRR